MRSSVWTGTEASFALTRTVSEADCLARSGVLNVVFDRSMMVVIMMQHYRLQRPQEFTAKATLAKLGYADRLVGRVRRDPKALTTADLEAVAAEHIKLVSSNCTVSAGDFSKILAFAQSNFATFPEVEGAAERFGGGGGGGGFGRVFSGTPVTPVTPTRPISVPSKPLISPSAPKSWTAHSASVSASASPSEMGLGMSGSELLPEGPESRGPMKLEELYTPPRTAPARTETPASTASMTTVFEGCQSFLNKILLTDMRSDDMTVKQVAVIELCHYLVLTQLSADATTTKKRAAVAEALQQLCETDCCGYRQMGLLRQTNNALMRWRPGSGRLGSALDRVQQKVDHTFAAVRSTPTLENLRVLMTLEFDQYLLDTATVSDDEGLLSRQRIQDAIQVLDDHRAFFPGWVCFRAFSTEDILAQKRVEGPLAKTFQCIRSAMIRVEDNGAGNTSARRWCLAEAQRQREGMSGSYGVVGPLYRAAPLGVRSRKDPLIDYGRYHKDSKGMVWG